MNQPSGWVGIGPVRKPDKVEAENLLHQFIIKGLAAAVFDPAEHLVGAPAPCWRRSEQRKRLVLAVPVGCHTVAAIEGSRDHRVLHFEGLGNRARRQKFDLEFAARHFIDTCDEIRRKLVKNVLGRPRALKLEIHRILCARHIRHGETCGTCRSGNGALLQESAARINVSLVRGLGHVKSPIWAPLTGALAGSLTDNGRMHKSNEGRSHAKLMVRFLPPHSGSGRCSKRLRP